MSKKIKAIKFDLPVEIYRSEILVVFTNDVQAYLKKIDEWEPKLAGSSSVTWENEDDSSYVATMVFPMVPAMYDLVHEANHAATIIANIVGIIPTPDEDEAYAYLNEFIFMKVVELKKKVRKRKRK